MVEGLFDLLRLIQVGGGAAKNVCDLVEGEAETFATQDELKPCVVAFVKKPVIAFSSLGAEEPLFFIKPYNKGTDIFQKKN